MIKISYSYKDKTVEKWEEKLTELVVGFRLQQTEGLTEPLLEEGATQLEGATAIQKFINDLEKEVNDWRTPRCGV